MNGTERFRLASWVTLHRDDGELLLVHDTVFAIRRLGRAADRVAKVLLSEEPFPIGAMSDILGTEKALRVVEQLLEHRLLTMTADSDDASRTSGTVHQHVRFYERFAVDAHCAHKRICDSRIAIIGLGGIGSEVLQHLLGAGARNFLLVDADEVQESNLNRQYMYRPTDVGRLKVDVATAVVQAYADSAAVKLLHSVFVPSKIWFSYDGTQTW